MTLKWIYYGLLLLCLLMLLVNAKKLARQHLFFIPVLSLAICTQFIAESMEGKPDGHYFLFHIYIPLEYLLLSMYYLLLFRSGFIKVFLITTNLVLLVFCAAYYFWGKRMWKPDYSDFVVESIFISFLVIYFFVRLFKTEQSISLLRYTDFWINTGNLFFYAGCMFVMGMHYSLREQNHVLAEELLQINYYLNLILYLFYLIGFSWKRPPGKYLR